MPFGGIGCSVRIVSKPSEHESAERTLSDQEAAELAASMHLFSSQSRLKLLWAMFDRSRTVDELAELANLTPSATSHQLKLLREAKLVGVERVGRQAFYSLHDHHIPDLLAALRHHQEHAESGQPDLNEIEGTANRKVGRAESS